MQAVKPDLSGAGDFLRVAFLADFSGGFSGGWIFWCFFGGALIFLRIFHPMSRRCFDKVLIINKLVDRALLLGMS